MLLADRMLQSLNVAVGHTTNVNVCYVVVVIQKTCRRGSWKWQSRSDH